jgi:hypothetical protein
MMTVTTIYYLYTVLFDASHPKWAETESARSHGLKGNIGCRYLLLDGGAL